MQMMNFFMVEILVAERGDHPIMTDRGNDDDARIVGDSIAVGMGENARVAGFVKGHDYSLRYYRSTEAEAVTLAAKAKEVVSTFPDVTVGVFAAGYEECSPEDSEAVLVDGKVAKAKKPIPIQV